MLEPRPAAVESPAAADSRACLNCGEPLRGPYCWKCGQEDLDLHRPLKHLARDAVGDLLNLDTRFLRTLGPLLFRPGLLIREYLAGRRVSYVPPLKMYLLATLIFFGLVALLPRQHFTVVRTTETAPGTGGSIRFQLPPIEDQSSWLGQRIEEASSNAEKDPDRFGATVLANLPRAFFLLLPAFALLLKLFYWKQDRYYLDHLIFALYFHAFVFIALTLRLVLTRPWMPHWIGEPLVLLLWLWLFLYLPIALRRVYGGTWKKTFLKLAGLLYLYVLVFGTTAVMLILTTLVWF